MVTTRGGRRGLKNQDNNGASLNTNSDTYPQFVSVRAVGKRGCVERYTRERGLVRVTCNRLHPGPTTILLLCPTLVTMTKEPGRSKFHATLGHLSATIDESTHFFLCESPSWDVPGSLTKRNRPYRHSSNRLFGRHAGEHGQLH